MSLFNIRTQNKHRIDAVYKSSYISNFGFFFTVVAKMKNSGGKFLFVKTVSNGKN